MHQQARSGRLLWLIAIGFLSQLVAHTQTPTSTARDAGAVNTVQAAIVALGGQAALSAIQDATVSGSCQSANANASYNSNAQTAVSWTISGREFRYLTRAEGEEHILVSGHGRPMVSESAATRALNPLTQALLKPYHFPGIVLVHELQDPSRSFKFMGTESIAGVQALHARIFTAVGGWPLPAFDQDWYFDPSSHLPVAVTYRLPTAVTSNVFVVATMIYQSFDTSQSMPTIQRLQTEYDGLDPKTCTLAAPTINSHPPAATFGVSE